ncbi:tRNA (adenosine(37)-N6)-threonylcarbamoyltransferase complex ATPase subunit type 1 TsaE [Desulfoscipio geothermicus]|uniref:tRNA threonylcarbamoyladenosine biosynthesis protein TsaE n=1 Tax=Desulfoscipio geothermicus DSM 3669 TaxID=1121426 RepID=A0A1I6DPG7_9FIRM|nr:tRNA (adenosine(37)-N6)-threonylcarbamoyltransferase complex ATPase subunit type 1 TsaE [Desulfoscipio geothermicus]SFR07281.1 tRNA threonylcarbamoyladenosine biosynthesis protein TsaE [Desulfoscipio geothermicus DSM 3669]
MFTTQTRSAGETLELGKTVGALLTAGDVISLDGDLGAGKTCFTTGVARGLGITGRVTSPTFTLINEYYSGRLPLYHLDVYRLGAPEELEDLGYEEYFYDTGVTMIEWAQKVENYLPPKRLDIIIEKSPEYENGRIFKIIPHGKRYEDLLRELMRRVYSGY